MDPKQKMETGKKEVAQKEENIRKLKALLGVK
jgi:hypothetical protein